MKPVEYWQFFPERGLMGDTNNFSWKSVCLRNGMPLKMAGQKKLFWNGAPKTDWFWSQKAGKSH
ncbi:MAG: hypothetical protein WCK54_20820 [Desulfuromonadales bacterium]